MPNTWKPDKFKPTTIKEKMDDKTFTVPIYQRGIVWNDKQRAELVDTIKRGLPFGSLLLYQDGAKYQIIDGLQRSTALCGFVENPAQFFNDDDIDDDVISELIRTTGLTNSLETVREDIKRTLIGWVKKHKTLSDIEGMQFYEFGEDLASVFPTCQGKEIAIGKTIRPMLQRFQELCKTINDIDVPAIIIEGDSSSLPILFERINSKGTQLSKYQIYAASWHDYKFSISSELVDLVKYNRDRYDTLLDGRTDIDDYDSQHFLNRMQLNAFEIAFGFGKHLHKKWPELFGKSADDTTVESVGFTLLNICLGQKYTEASNMNNKMKELAESTNINTFLLKILESVKFVEKRISKYSNFKLNSRSEPSPLHSEMQICAIVASIFFLKYASIDINDEEKLESFSLHLDSVNDEWKTKHENQLKKHLAKRYIMEILQGRWSGSGNLKLDQIILINDYYAQSISKDSFFSTIDNWFNTMNIERQERTKVTKPKEPELLLLSALYLNSFSADAQLNDMKFDIEHLATKQKMKEQLERLGPDVKLPISSFGNLCILPEYENRSKGKKTLYEDTEYLSKSNMTLAEIEKNYSFTKETDLDWLLDLTSTKEEFIESYLLFVNNRYTTMKKILDNNFDKL